MHKVFVVFCEKLRLLVLTVYHTQQPDYNTEQWVTVSPCESVIEEGRENIIMSGHKKMEIILKIIQSKLRQHKMQIV